MKKYIKAAKTEAEIITELAKYTEEINNHLRTAFNILIPVKNSITEDEKLLYDKLDECADLVYEAQQLSADVAKYYANRAEKLEEE